MAAPTYPQNNYKNKLTTRYIGMKNHSDKIQQSPSIGMNFATSIQDIFLKDDEQHLMREENFTDA